MTYSVSILTGAIAALTFVSTTALCQTGLPPGVRGPESGLATRSVSNYLRVERDLLESLKAGKRDAILGMLSDDFIVRSASQNDELSAIDWLTSELGNPIETANVRDLSVRELDDIAIVSFLLDSRHGVKPKAVSSTLYVVDVWRKSTNKLVGRFVSEPKHTPPIPPRPTGKE
jgi:hypothetical protein